MLGDGLQSIQSRIASLQAQTQGSAMGGAAAYRSQKPQQQAAKPSKDQLANAQAFANQLQKAQGGSGGNDILASLTKLAGATPASGGFSGGLTGGVAGGVGGPTTGGIGHSGKVGHNAQTCPDCAGSTTSYADNTTSGIGTGNTAAMNVANLLSSLTSGTTSPSTSALNAIIRGGQTGGIGQTGYALPASTLGEIAMLLASKGQATSPAGQLLAQQLTASLVQTVPAAMGNTNLDAEIAAIKASPVGTHPAMPARRKGSLPAELRGETNGKLPADLVEKVGFGKHSLYKPAAQSFKKMIAAAQRDGVTIGVNSSYRTQDEQAALVRKYGLYSNGGRAAAPGRSNHGWGLSIDLQLNNKAQAWMRDNGKYYGFVEDVKREPWHWTYKAA